MQQKLLLIINEKIKPKVLTYYSLIKAKWQTLAPREQKLVGTMLILLAVFLVVSILSGLANYKAQLVNRVSSLSQFINYAENAKTQAKQLKKINANSFNSPNRDQVKADISQILGIKDPDIFIQDNQITINVPNVEFSKVMTLLDQFRRSYNLYPSSLSIIRQSKSGFVSVNAVFWVKNQ